MINHLKKNDCLKDKIFQCLNKCSNKIYMNKNELI